MLPAKPSVVIRPLARNNRLTYYWSAGADSTFTLDISGIGIPGPITIGPSTNVYTVTGLTNGTDYYASLYNNDGMNVSEPAVFRTVKPGNKPSIVQNVSAHPGEGGLHLQWHAPDSDGGAAIGWYVVTDLTSGERYNTYGTDTAFTVPYTPGHQYKIQAVNDPGYSPTVLLQISGTYSLMNILQVDASPNYQYQVYDKNNDVWSPLIDSGYAVADYSVYNASTGGDSFFWAELHSQNPEADGYTHRIKQFIGADGTLHRSIIFPENSPYGDDYNANMSVTFYPNSTIEGTLDVTIYDAVTDRLQRSSFVDMASQYINDIIPLETGVYFAVYDSNITGYSHYIWSAANPTPTLISTMGNGYTTASAGTANTMIGAMQDPDSGSYDTVFSATGDGTFNISTLNHPEYGSVHRRDLFGASSANGFLKFANYITESYDYYIFRNLPSLEATQLSNIGQTSYYHGEQYFDPNGYYDATGSNNHFLVVDAGSGSSGYVTTAVAYTLLEGKSTFASTFFTEGNPYLSFFYGDPADAAVMNRTGVYLFGLNGQANTAEATRVGPAGQLTSTLVDLSDVSMPNLGDFTTLDDYFYFPFEVSGNSGIRWQIHNSSLQNVGTFDDPNFNEWTQSGNNFIYQATNGGGFSAFSEGFFSTFSDPFFTGSYVYGLRNDYAETPGDPMPVWGYSIDSGSISTVCVYNSTLTFAGIPIGITGGGTNYRCLGGYFTLYNNDAGVSPFLFCIVSPAGSTFVYQDDIFTVHDNYAFQNTDRLITIRTSNTDTGVHTSVIFNKDTGLITSTTIDPTSTMHATYTNYPWDYWNN